MRRPAALLGSLVLLFALNGAAGATAATYAVVQSGPESWTLMDPAGIETIPGAGTLRRAWTVRVQRNILTGDPPQPGYVRTLSEYDCDQTQMRWLEFTAFSRSGAALVSKTNPNPEWGLTTDASETYNAFRMVCRVGRGGAVVSADSIAKVVISLMAAWDPPVPAPTAKRVIPAKPATKLVKPVVGPGSLKRSSIPAAPKAAPVAKVPVTVSPKAG